MRCAFRWGLAGNLSAELCLEGHQTLPGGPRRLCGEHPGGTRGARRNPKRERKRSRIARRPLPFFALLLSLSLLSACSPSRPVGIYRLPVPKSEGGVELRTFIVAAEPRTLLLYDGRDGSEYGRGLAAGSWGATVQTHRFDVPASSPLLLIHRDGVLEDLAERPYRQLPARALSEDIDSLYRVKLSSGGESLYLNSVEGQIFADLAEAQLEDESIPNLLQVLNSVAGQGLLLTVFEESGEWKDAMSSAVLYDAELPLPCGASLLSVYRARPERVSVPAGEFDAIRITEIIDACHKEDPAKVHVFRVERWFAPGVGPVQLELEGELGGSRRFQLRESKLAAGASGASESEDGADATGATKLWPLDQGNTWVFEVSDQHGDPHPAQTLKVESMRQILLP